MIEVPMTNVDTYAGEQVSKFGDAELSG